MTTNNIPHDCLPFDLEKALAGHPVRTEHGEIISEIYYFKTANSEKNVYAVANGVLHSYLPDGRLYRDDTTICDLFLVKPEPKKVKVWIAILDNPDFLGRRDTGYAFTDEIKCKNSISHEAKRMGAQIIEAEIEVRE